MYLHHGGDPWRSQPIAHQDSVVASHLPSKEELEKQKVDDQDSQTEIAGGGEATTSEAATYDERLLESLLERFSYTDWFNKHDVTELTNEDSSLKASEASIQRILSQAVSSGALAIQKGSGRRPHQYQFIEHLEKNVMDGELTPGSDLEVLERIKQKELELQKDLEEVTQQLKEVEAERETFEKSMLIRRKYQS